MVVVPVPAPEEPDVLAPEVVPPAVELPDVEPPVDPDVVPAVVPQLPSVETLFVQVGAAPVEVLAVVGE